MGDMSTPLQFASLAGLCSLKLDVTVIWNNGFFWCVTLFMYLLLPNWCVLFLFFQSLCARFINFNNAFVIVGYKVPLGNTQTAVVMVMSPVHQVCPKPSCKAQ